MATFLFWGLAFAAALPFVALTVAYRAIVAQKIVEVEDRLQTYDTRSYAAAYGRESGVCDRLKELYHWRTYVAPLLLTSLVSVAFAAAALTRAGADLGMPAEFATTIRRITLTALAGAAGGYLWAIYDVIRRYGSADLTAPALHFTWFRIVMAGGVGALFGIALAEEIGLIGAFAIGALPLNAMWDFIRQKSNITVERAPADAPRFHLIQGLTTETIDRLEHEGIDSVQKLAFADPVRLLFRTNLEWNAILDLIDQALLVVYVDEQVVQLRICGIRGVLEVASLDLRFRTGDAAEQRLASDTIDYIAAKLGESPVAIRNLAYVLDNDPLIDFLWAYWDSTDRRPSHEAIPVLT